MSGGSTPKETEASDSANRIAAGQAEAANDQRIDALTRTLNRVRAEALFALDWWRERNPQQAAPLEPVAKILSANNLVVSEGLGKAGFRSDPENFEILFNASVLRRIGDVISTLFTEEGEETRDELQRQAIGLYVFHEITHIAQKFVEHRLATSMKAAFTPDELSKIDLVADVRAAHCSALVSTAISGADSGVSYLNSYRDNLLLSYQILVRAFPISGDHKKKRSLGILTNVVLTQAAIHADDDRRSKMVALAVRPAFTSVDQEAGSIVALTCAADGWEILFHGTVRTNRMSIPQMWDEAGCLDPMDIIALLSVAYDRLM